MFLCVEEMAHSLILAYMLLSFSTDELVKKFPSAVEQELLGGGGAVPPIYRPSFPADILRVTL
jgi:hypothetical protein